MKARIVSRVRSTDTGTPLRRWQHDQAVAHCGNVRRTSIGKYYVDPVKIVAISCRNLARALRLARSYPAPYDQPQRRRVRVRRGMARLREREEGIDGHVARRFARPRARLRRVPGPIGVERRAGGHAAL